MRLNSSTIYEISVDEYSVIALTSTKFCSDEELFIALVDKVVVGEKLTFVLRDGSEW